MEETGIDRNRQDGDADKDRLIEELRAAVRARDEFVAIAAHELRNPITPILIQIGLLHAAANDPNRCRPELIAPRVERLESAIQEFVRRSTVLLDVSRIASGNIRVDLADVDLSALVDRVISRATLAAQRARCRLHEEVQEGVTGLWDPLALEQVTENLLTNAIKFGAGKPVTIVLHADDQTAQLTVRDQGIGISEEDRSRIFQRFERAVTQREHGGFGIGLWLANQLIMAMAGTITVESAPGEGSRFTVTLPRSRAAEHEVGNT
jgi:signal transduction histidine kinase